MKGLILAGGTGSRLLPLTKVTNKHLLPVGKYPMIFHPMYKLLTAGISDILVVTGKEHMGDVVSLLGSGADYGANITYRVQDRAGGIAEALGLAEEFVGDGLVTVLLGDNIFQDDISKHVRSFSESGIGAKILVKEVHDPQRYGVAEFDGDRIVSIEEKPALPKTNFAVTGIYMYNHDVFNIVKSLNPSARGELEITDVNNAYIRKGTMAFGILDGWWTDAGTHESLQKAHVWASEIRLP